MARYDKYDPYVGGFRAPLAADWLSADLNKPFGVGLNAQGQVVKGNGTTGIQGVLILTKALKAGDIVDIMTAGEIVEWGPTAGTPGTDFGVAATNYLSNAAGDIAAGGAADAAGHIGTTVAGQRLIVRVVQGAAAA